MALESFPKMIQKKRRSTVCHNCDSPLDESYNFCPRCGQSNSDNNVTFTTLIKEFIDNYLGIDSKMAHSALPFLTKPGNLTNRFQEGKIKHFIHPIRLYFVMSLIYFFTISFLLSSFDLRSFEGESSRFSGTVDLEDLVKKDRWKSLSDSVKLSFVPDSLVNRYDDFLDFNDFYAKVGEEFGENFLKDTDLRVRNVNLPQSSKENTVDRYHRLARDRRISDKAFMDSLSGGGNNFNIGGGFLDESQDAHVAKQVRKIFENDQGFKAFVLGNLPLMMFILIPLFAGVLKFIYVRRKHLYIKHVVHALHVHSFAYFMYALALLIIFKIITPGNFPNMNIEAWRGILSGVFFIGVSTYVYASFLKVYKQGWFKTLIKFNIVGFTYSFFLLFFFIIEVSISFWYY